MGCVPGAADPKEREGPQEIFLGKNKSDMGKGVTGAGVGVTKWGTERQLT